MEHVPAKPPAAGFRFPNRSAGTCSKAIGWESPHRAGRLAAMNSLDGPVAPRLYWYETGGDGRNLFAKFQRVLRIGPEEVVGRARLHLFADSLYRLTVNGNVLGQGPARFAPTHPEYDTHDIGGCLREGENLIEVEVQSRGTGCYQAVPGGRGGLAAWGSVETSAGTVDLSLPHGWTVSREPSRDGGGGRSHSVSPRDPWKSETSGSSRNGLSHRFFRLRGFSGVRFS